MNSSKPDEPSDTLTTESEVDPDRKAIFDAVLLHLLTDPRIKHSREFYGTAGDRKFALVANQGYGVPWPDWYIPSVEGFQSTRVLADTSVDASQPRLLGIRLDKFNVDDVVVDDEDQLFDGQIHVTLLTAGGTGDGPIPIGGCILYYDTTRDRDKWTVEFKGSLDP